MSKLSYCLFSSSRTASHHLDIRDCFHRGKVTILETDLLSWSSTQVKIACDTYPYTFITSMTRQSCHNTTIYYISFSTNPCNTDTEVLRCCFSCCSPETEVTFTINGKKYTGMLVLWMYWLKVKWYGVLLQNMTAVCHVLLQSMTAVCHVLQQNMTAVCHVLQQNMTAVCHVLLQNMTAVCHVT